MSSNGYFAENGQFWGVGILPTNRKNRSTAVLLSPWSGLPRSWMLQHLQTRPLLPPCCFRPIAPSRHSAKPSSLPDQQKRGVDHARAEMTATRLFGRRYDHWLALSQRPESWTRDWLLPLPHSAITAQSWHHLPLPLIRLPRAPSPTPLMLLHTVNGLQLNATAALLGANGALGRRLSTFHHDFGLHQPTTAHQKIASLVNPTPPLGGYSQWQSNGCAEGREMPRTSK